MDDPILSTISGVIDLPVQKPIFEPLYNIGDIVKIKESGDLGIVVRITLLGNILINKVIVKVNNITNLYTYEEILAVNM
jgi:hypothetical protein